MKNFNNPSLNFPSQQCCRLKHRFKHNIHQSETPLFSPPLMNNERLLYKQCYSNGSSAIYLSSHISPYLGSCAYLSYRDARFPISFPAHCFTMNSGKCFPKFLCMISLFTSGKSVYRVEIFSHYRAGNAWLADCSINLSDYFMVILRLLTHYIVLAQRSLWFLTSYAHTCILHWENMNFKHLHADGLLI